MRKLNKMIRPGTVSVLAVTALIALAGNISERTSTPPEQISTARYADSDNVPDTPDMTLVADTNGDPCVSVTLTVPLKDKSGNNLSAPVTAMTLYRAGKAIKNLSVATGQKTLQLQDTVSSNDKKYTYAVSATNSYGESDKRSETIYVGVYKPGKPTEVKIRSDFNLNKCHLRWKAPLLDFNNRPLPRKGLSYTVRVKDSSGTKVLKKGITETSLDYEYTGSGSEVISFSVTADNRKGSSAQVWSNSTFLGTPSSTPISESFANGKQTSEILFNTEGKLGLLREFCTEAVKPSVPASDNDNGYLGVRGLKGCVLHLSTNYLDLSTMNDPVATLSVYKAEGQPHTELQIVAMRDSVMRVLGSYDLRNLPLTGWNPVGVSLASMKGNNEQVLFRVTYNHGNNYCFLDNIYIGEKKRNDVSVGDIRVEEVITRGEPNIIRATVSNHTPEASAPIKATLWRDGKQVKAMNLEPVGAFSAVNVEFNDAIPTVEKDTTYKYQISVSMNGDVNAANDTTNIRAGKTTVAVLPSVRSLASSRSNGTVQLNWLAPDAAAIPMPLREESFETYTPWGNNFGDWLTIDGDMREVKGFAVNHINLPAAQGKQAFFVFDIDQFPDDTDLTPATGKGHRYAASLPSKPDSSDDWLISPALNGCSQSISFWALGYFHFRTPFEVYYSTTGRDTADFKLLKADAYNASWKKFSYQLPEGSKYFAIHTNLRGAPYTAPIMCFDDFRFIPEGAGKATLKGYNVYHEGKLLNETPIEGTSFTFSQIPGASTFYDVTALFDRGESIPVTIDIYNRVTTLDYTSVSITAGKESILISIPESQSCAVYTLQGMKVKETQLSAGQNSISVPAGIYIVTLGSKAYKLIVS